MQIDYATPDRHRWIAAIRRFGVWRLTRWLIIVLVAGAGIGFGIYGGRIAWIAYQVGQWGLKLHARPVVRRGDPVVLQLVWGPYPKTNEMMEMHFHAVSIEIAGQNFTPSAAFVGRIREIPNYATQNAFPSYQILNIPPALFATLPDGPVTVRCDAEVTTRMLDHTFTRRVSLSSTFTLVAATSPTLTVVTNPARRPDSRILSIQANGGMDGGTMKIGVSLHDGERILFEPFATFRLSTPPKDLCIVGDVIVSFGGTVLAAGATARPDQYGSTFFDLKLPPGAALPSTIDLTIVPNPARAAESLNITEIWGEPITIKGIPVKPWN